MTRVLVWDLPTRFFHWLLSSGFIAAAVIALLWLALAATVKLFWRASVPAGVLLVSYLARVSFVAMPNFPIWWLNP